MNVTLLTTWGKTFESSKLCIQGNGLLIVRLSVAAPQDRGWRRRPTEGADSDTTVTTETEEQEVWKKRWRSWRG